MRTRVRAGLAAGTVISVVAATLFTLIQLSDQLIGGLTPEFGSPSPVSLRVPHGSVAIQGEHTAFWDAHRVFLPVGTVLNPDDPVHQAVLEFESARRPPRRPGPPWSVT